jgi:hypothetical protein
VRARSLTTTRLQGNLARPPGIEGVEMRKVYYNLLPSCSVPLALAFALAAGPRAAAQDASLKTASLESHEGMTISAQPWTDAAKYKEKFPKKSPYPAGVLALQVSFRNDSNDSIKVNLKRIRLTVHLDEDNTQELPSLSAEEVADAVFKPAAKDPSKRTRLPIPIGVGGSKNSRDKNWTEVQTAAQNAAVPTGVIAPHSTVQGLLYFNLQKQFDLLETSHLYIPDLLLMQENRALTFFDIDLSRRSSP